MENFSPRDRVVILLGLFAREVNILNSIADAKRFELDHLDKLENELKECLELQKRVI